MENQTNTGGGRRKTANIPNADLDLSTLLLSIAPKYANCGVALPWITPAQAIQLGEDYQAELQLRLTEGSKRKPITQQIKEEEAKQDKHLSYVKGYLADKFGKDNAKSYYAEFGLDKSDKSYRFPDDKDKRLESLRKMANSLDTHGMTGQTFGQVFWADLLTSYQSLITSAREKDSLVTGKVSAKNRLKDEGRVFANSMIHLVKALYPGDAKAKLREWGFQKEKY